MRLGLIVLGLAVSSLPAFAQEYHSDDYNKSVYNGFKDLKPHFRTNQLQLQSQVDQLFPGMNFTRDRLNGSLTGLFGKATPIAGGTLRDKARNLVEQKLSAFGLNWNEWQEVRNQAAPHASFLDFRQEIDGRPVVFSKLQFRFTTDGRVERIKIKTYGQPAAGLQPQVTPAQAEQLVLGGLQGVSVTTKTLDENWVWFPVPSQNDYKLTPAYAFEVQGTTDRLPVDLYGWVDATTGEVLYQSNHVHETVDVTVKGNIYKENANLPASDEPLKNLRITLQGQTGSFYTDTAGVFEETSLNAPVTATVYLQGKWSKVNVGSNGVTPSFQYEILNNGTTYHFPDSGLSNIAARTAYYHVDKIHDYMKGFFPAFPSMDNALATNVDITTNANNNCNAFYNGTSINFYAAWGSCNSFATSPDIVYHEYAHGINRRFYGWQGAGNMSNGALNEGNADVWAMAINQDPVMGEGAFIGSAVIRRYDMAPKVYPHDIVGEVHADGEIIAGAWWDVAVNLNDPEMMAELFAKTYWDTPDGPNGTEGEVYYDVLISALMNDDNDNDLNNGTPNFQAIVEAFARHGIYLLGDAHIQHEELAHQPTGAAIDVQANVTVSTPAFLGDIRLFYKERASTGWDSVQMNLVSGNTYAAQIPAQSEGSIVDYYFSVYDNFGGNRINAVAPAGYLPGALITTQSNIPYQFGVGIQRAFGTDFESPLSGWTIGNVPGDNATSGIWIHAVPIPSYVNSAAGQIMVQPGYDKTLGQGQQGKALVTGNAPAPSTQVGLADVDNGRTSVITPVFDLTGFTNPIIEYYRWYTNDKGSNPGADFWTVHIKGDVGNIWFKMVERTRISDNSWRRRIFSVDEQLPGFSKVMLKFTAEDLNPGSAVEAAVDDIFIYDNESALSVEGVSPAVRAQIFPNPASSQVTVRLPQQAEGTISLHDLSGKEIQRVTIANSNEQVLDVQSVPAGIYMLMIRTAESIQVSKISVVH